MRIAPSICPKTPRTAKTPRPEVIHGHKVEDDYRWLEWDTGKRDKWIDAQTERTDCHLDSYPRHQEIKDRLLTALKAQSTAYTGEMQQGDDYQLQWSRQSGEQFSTLRRFDEGSEQGQVLFNPNDWPKGETPGWATVSPDKRYLAYGRVIKGKDSGRMEIMDLQSGEVIRSMDGQDAQDPPTWAAKDDKLYFAPHLQRGVFSLDISDAEAKMIAHQSFAPYGDMAEHNGSLLFTASAPTYLDEEAFYVGQDGITSKSDLPSGRMDFARDGSNVFVSTTADAPNGKVMLVDMNQAKGGEAPESRLLVAESESRAITGITALKDSVAVSYTEKAMPGLAIYNLDGEVVRELSFDEPGTLTAVKADESGNLRFSWSSLIQPPTKKKLDIETGEISTISEQTIPEFNPENFKTERRWYKSADGIEVPITLAFHKDTEMNGENPAHIYVYGGFSTAINPSFSVTRLPFLEAGGVYAIAHVRGGAELGEEWHSQAMGLNRTKVYDDVAGAAKFLADEGYTSSDHLSIEGASNGGLVAGVAATRDPSLFDAVISEVGLHDMARYEQMGGKYWNQEYGSIKNEAEAEGLLSWSPYHNVKEGVDYPAVMVTTGKNDDRVDPAHSFKFAAKMQEVETVDSPVYLRVNGNLGHGHGATNEQWADRYADQWAFLLSELTDVDKSSSNKTSAS